jgi:hypothetical protein
VLRCASREGSGSDASQRLALAIPQEHHRFPRRSRLLRSRQRPFAGHRASGYHRPVAGLCFVARLRRIPSGCTKVITAFGGDLTGALWAAETELPRPKTHRRRDSLSLMYKKSSDLGNCPTASRQRNGATQVGRKTKAIAAAGRTTSSCRHQRGSRPLGRCRQRAASRALLLFGPVLGTCVPRVKVAASASGSRTAAWACGSDQSQVFAGARSGEPGWPARVCRFHGRHVPAKSR